MTKVQNTNVSAAAQVENKKVKKQQQKKEQQVFKGNGNKQTAQKTNDSAFKQEIYKKTGFQLKDTANRGKIIPLKVNGKIRNYETIGTLTTGGRILVKEQGKEVYHVVSHTKDNKLVMLKDDYAKKKIFYDSTSAQHKVKIGKKNYVITNSSRDRHGRMTAIDSRGQEVILSHDGKELKRGYVEAEDQKDNLEDYIAQQTKGKSKAEAAIIRQQILNGNSSYSNKGVLRFKASNGEVWYYDTKRKTYVKYAEKEAQAIIKDLDKAANGLFRIGLGTDYALMKNTNAQIIDPEVLGKVNKHYSAEYSKKVDKNAQYGSGKYRTAYEAFLASEISDDEVYQFNAALVKNNAITDQSRRNEILQTNLTKVGSRANRLAAADAASRKEDYQTLQDAAEEANKTKKYKAQFKGQDALQTYIYGVHDGDVQDIEDFNNALIDPKKDMLDKDEIVRIKAETGALWLKKGNFKKGFEAQDTDVTKQMFALQSSNGKAVLNAKTLKQQAAKEKQDDYMMMARPDLYSDKELASRAAQLLKIALHDLNNYHSIEFQMPTRSATGNFDVSAKGKVDWIKEAEENISRAYSMIRNDKILAMVKKEMGNNYNLLLQREHEHLKTDNLKNITTITDTQVTEYSDKEGKVKLTPEQIAHNKYVVTWLKSQLADLEREKKFNEAKEGWKQDFVNNSRELLFGGVTRASLADKYNLIKSNMTRLEAAAEGKLLDANGKPVSFEDAMKNLGETGIQALEQANQDYQSAQATGEFMVDMAVLAIPLPKSFNAANTVIKMGNTLYKVISKSDKVCKVVKITQEAAKSSKIYEVATKVATKNPKLVENARKVATIMDSSATGAMHMAGKTVVLDASNIATSREGFTSDRISEMNEKVKSAGKFGGMGGFIGGSTGMLAEYVSSTGAKYVVHGLGLVTDIVGAAGLMTAESHGETNFWDNLRCVNPDGSFNFEQAAMTAMMIYGHLHGASTIKGKSMPKAEIQADGTVKYTLNNRELVLSKDGIFTDSETGRKFKLATNKNSKTELAELTKKEIYNSRQKTEVKDGMTLEDFRQELKNNDLRGNVYTKADGGRLVVVKHSFNKYELYEFDTNNKMISQKSVKGKSAIKESYPEFANAESSGTIGSTSGYLGMNNPVGNGNNTEKVKKLQDNVKMNNVEPTSTAQVKNLEKYDIMFQSKEGKAFLDEAKKDPNFGKTAEERVPSDKIVKDADGNIQSIEIDGVTYTRNEQGKYVNGDSEIKIYELNEAKTYDGSIIDKEITIDKENNKILKIESDDMTIEYDSNGQPEKVSNLVNTIYLSTGNSSQNFGSVTVDSTGRVIKNEVSIDIEERKYEPYFSEGNRYSDWNKDTNGQAFTYELREKTRSDLSKLIKDAQLENRGLRTTKKGRQKAYDDLRNQIEDAYNNNKISREDADNLHAKLNEKAEANGLETQETPTMVAEREALAKWNEEVDTVKDNLMSEIEKVDSQVAHDQMVEKIGEVCKNGKIDMERANELYKALETKAKSLDGVETLSQKKVKIEKQVREIETAQRIEAAEAKSRHHAELLDEYLAESGENLPSEIGSKEYYDEALSTIDRGVKNGSIEPQKAEVLRTQLKEQLAKLESESNKPAETDPASHSKAPAEESQVTETSTANDKNPVKASENEANQQKTGAESNQSAPVAPSPADFPVPQAEKLGLKPSKEGNRIDFETFTDGEHPQFVEIDSNGNPVKRFIVSLDQNGKPFVEIRATYENGKIVLREQFDEFGEVVAKEYADIPVKLSDVNNFLKEYPDFKKSETDDVVTITNQKTNLTIEYDQSTGKKLAATQVDPNGFKVRNTFDEDGNIVTIESEFEYEGNRYLETVDVNNQKPKSYRRIMDENTGISSPDGISHELAQKFAEGTVENGKFTPKEVNEGANMGEEVFSPYEVIEQNAEGKPTKTALKDVNGNVLEYNYNEYDSNGNVAKTTSKDVTDKVTASHEFEYDSSHNLIKETVKDADGKIKTTIESEYNDGKLTKEIIKNAEGTTENVYRDGELAEITEYEYQNGKVVKSIKKQLKNDEVVSSTESEYNDGNVVKEKITNKKGIIEQEYNNGKLITETIKDVNGNTTQISKLEYKDQNLRPTKTTETQYKDDKVVKTTEYEYDDGYKLTKTTQKDAEGKITQVTEKEYSNNDVPTKETKTQFKDGEITEITETEYKDLNPTKEIQKDANGKITKIYDHKLQRELTAEEIKEYISNKDNNTQKQEQTPDGKPVIANNGEGIQSPFEITADKIVVNGKEQPIPTFEEAQNTLNKYGGNQYSIETNDGNRLILRYDDNGSFIGSREEISINGKALKDTSRNADGTLDKTIDYFHTNDGEPVLIERDSNGKPTKIKWYKRNITFDKEGKASYEVTNEKNEIINKSIEEVLKDSPELKPLLEKQGIKLVEESNSPVPPVVENKGEGTPAPENNGKGESKTPAQEEITAQQEIVNKIKNELNKIKPELNEEQANKDLKAAEKEFDILAKKTLKEARKIGKNVDIQAIKKALLSDKKYDSLTDKHKRIVNKYKKAKANVEAIKKQQELQNKLATEQQKLDSMQEAAKANEKNTPETNNNEGQSVTKDSLEKDIENVKQDNIEEYKTKAKNAQEKGIISEEEYTELVNKAEEKITSESATGNKPAETKNEEQPVTKESLENDIKNIKTQDDVQEYIAKLENAKNKGIITEEEYIEFMEKAGEKRKAEEAAKNHADEVAEANNGEGQPVTPEPEKQPVIESESESASVNTETPTPAKPSMFDRLFHRNKVKLEKEVASGEKTIGDYKFNTVKDENGYVRTKTNNFGEIEGKEYFNAKGKKIKTEEYYSDGKIVTEGNVTTEYYVDDDVDIVKYPNHKEVKFIYNEESYELEGAVFTEKHNPLHPKRLVVFDFTKGNTSSSTKRRTYYEYNSDKKHFELKNEKGEVVGTATFDPKTRHWVEEGQYSSDLAPKTTNVSRGEGRFRIKLPERNKVPKNLRDENGKLREGVKPFNDGYTETISKGGVEITKGYDSKGTLLLEVSKEKATYYNAKGEVIAEEKPIPNGVQRTEFSKDYNLEINMKADKDRTPETAFIKYKSGPEADAPVEFKYNEKSKLFENTSPEGTVLKTLKYDAKNHSWTIKDAEGKTIETQENRIESSHKVRNFVAGTSFVGGGIALVGGGLQMIAPEKPDYPLNTESQKPTTQQTTQPTTKPKTEQSSNKVTLGDQEGTIDKNTGTITIDGAEYPKNPDATYNINGKTYKLEGNKLVEVVDTPDDNGETGGADPDESPEVKGTIGDKEYIIKDGKVSVDGEELTPDENGHYTIGDDKYKIEYGKLVKVEPEASAKATNSSTQTSGGSSGGSASGTTGSQSDRRTGGSASGTTGSQAGGRTDGSGTETIGSQNENNQKDSSKFFEEILRQNVINDMNQKRVQPEQTIQTQDDVITPQEPQRIEKRKITPQERMELTEKISKARNREDIEKIQKEMRKYKVFSGRKNLRRAYKAKLRAITHDGEQAKKYDGKFKKRWEKITESDVYKSDKSKQYNDLLLKNLNYVDYITNTSVDIDPNGFNA